MRIKQVIISTKIKEKVYLKHNVSTEEIEDVLTKNKPIFRKVGGNQYKAFGKFNRYLTIYFEYDHKSKRAKITTAYPSSKKEIRFYKKQ